MSSNRISEYVYSSTTKFLKIKKIKEMLFLFSIAYVYQVLMICSLLKLLSKWDGFNNNKHLMSKICLSLNKDKLFVIFLQGVCFITPYYTNSSICV